MGEAALVNDIQYEFGFYNSIREVQGNYADVSAVLYGTTTNPSAGGIVFNGSDNEYLDISNLAQLEFLDLYDNNLSSVDISNNPNLTEIRLNFTYNITTMDFSNNLLLETVLLINFGAIKLFSTLKELQL